MKRVRLDFAARPSSGRAGLALLAAGIAALSAVGYELAELSAQTEAWSAKVADLRRLSERRFTRVDLAAAGNPALAGEVRGANAVLAQMTVPWNALFRELEGAAGRSVALLAVQPDPAGRQVRISGEARNMQALLDYMSKLERGGMLKRVVLTGHDVKQSGSQRPVGFSLVAEWAIPA